MTDSRLHKGDSHHESFRPRQRRKPSLANQWSERRTSVSKRPRVLLVDDHPNMLKAISRLLAPDCEVVGSLADGGALLETAHRLEPDVVVLDVNLPDIVSLEACREITRINPGIKVIMFTAMNDPIGSQAFFDAGASAFVSKLAADDLVSTIKRLCAVTVES